MILSDEKMTILFCILCGITFQVCTGQSATIWWWQGTQSLPLTGTLAFGKVDGGTFHFQQICDEKRRLFKIKKMYKKIFLKLEHWDLKNTFCNCKKCRSYVQSLY